MKIRGVSTEKLIHVGVAFVVLTALIFLSFYVFYHVKDLAPGIQWYEIPTILTLLVLWTIILNLFIF